MDIHPSLLLRKVIHVDMDAFFAAVEILDRPELAGKPVVVGGSPSGRGVVQTASYEARKYGIHSAMPAARAVKLCPHAVFVRGNFKRYIEISEAIREIFRRYTDQVATVSLDEAYLDVTDITIGGGLARDIAVAIRQDIAEELGLTASAGVGPNKLVAKIASDFRKPDGLTCVAPSQVEEFMAPLKLKKIPGVGPVSVQKLERHQLIYCRDVLAWGPDRLVDKLGTYGQWLYRKCRGIDDSTVASRRSRRSMGHERTFSQDLTKREDYLEILQSLSERLAQDLRGKLLAGKTVSLKVKFHDFRVMTRSRSGPYVSTKEALFETVQELLDKEQFPEGTRIRLLGVSVANLETTAGAGVKIGRYFQPLLFP